MAGECGDGYVDAQGRAVDLRAGRRQGPDATLAIRGGNPDHTWVGCWIDQRRERAAILEMAHLFIAFAETPRIDEFLLFMDKP
jgi:hypothetical protein